MTDLLLIKYITLKLAFYKGYRIWMLNCPVAYSTVGLPKLDGMIIACCSQDNWFTGTICFSHPLAIICAYLLRLLHEISPIGAKTYPFFNFTIELHSLHESFLETSIPLSSDGRLIHSLVSGVGTDKTSETSGSLEFLSEMPETVTFVKN